MGVAGSLANMISECVFHVVDTVNIRTKASTSSNSTTISTVNKIWKKEGVMGFGKGFSACFYSSIVCGFTYFSLYRLFKGHFKDNFEDKVDVGYCFLGAALSTQFLTLIFQYPYDLIKCRLQSVNYIFKYQNLVHACKQQCRKHGFLSLYEGVLPFLLTYTTFVGL